MGKNPIISFYFPYSNMGDLLMYNKMMPTKNSYIQYVVQPNDSLYMIAKAYNTTVEEIKSINHLVSNTIYPNQVLYIPTSSCNKQTYITKSGDSLNDILKKFNINVDDFNEYNDVKKLKLEENQLISTERKNEENKVHIVNNHEKIEDILAKYHLSPLEFLKLNEDTILIVGTRIIVM